MVFRQRNILIVGAGIQGLLTALAVNKPGTAVTVHSAGCDPRTPGDCRAATSSGEAGRFVTPLEGHPYLGDSAIYPNMAAAVATTVSAGGWLGRPVDDYSPAEQAWLRHRRIANGNAQAIAETADWYAATSLESMRLWRRLFADRADLFAHTSLITQTGVLCCYETAELADLAASVHQKRGTLKAVIDPATVARQTPSLAQACDGGTIGGALLIDGYSFDVKKLTANLIGSLEQAGVTFIWESVCRSIEYDHAGRVGGLVFEQGVRSADDYLIHPGAYAGEAFRLDDEADLAGIAGRWLLLPKPADFHRPAKVHFSPRIDPAGQKRAVMDLNVTPYFDAERQRGYLAIGGGYLHVGRFPFRLEERERQLLDAELEHAVRRLMPAWFAECESAGTIIRSDATCVRAFTPDDRPAVVCRETNRGGHLLLHAGLNTGAAAMAPAVADRIARFLAGDRSAIDSLRPTNSQPSSALSRKRVGPV